MRKIIVALALASAIAPAFATGLSMNEVVLAAGTTLDQCKAQGTVALAKAGLTAMPASAASVFGGGKNGELAAVYCLPARGIAMVGVAGSDNALTRPILFAVMAAMNKH